MAQHSVSAEAIHGSSSAARTIEATRQAIEDQANGHKRPSGWKAKGKGVDPARRKRDEENARYKTMDARTIFSILNPQIQASRPVIGLRRGGYRVDKSGRKRYFGKPTEILGAPTLRNVINEHGEHV